MNGNDRLARLRFGVLLLAASVSFVLAGCRAESKDAKPESAVTPTVKVATPQLRTFAKTIEQPGWIKAYERAPLYTKISGYVKNVQVEIGSLVEKDDILAELRVPEMVEELKQKQVLVAQARIGISQAEKAVQLARAKFETAGSLVKESKSNLKRAAAERERWKSECARLERLVARQVIDEQIRDETRNQCKAAEAAWELAGTKIESAEALRKETEAGTQKAETDLEAAHKHLEAAQADERHMKALLDYAVIRAPFKGVVSQRHVDPGHFVLPGTSSNGPKGEPLFVVIRKDLVRIFLDVPESDAVWVKKGCPARVRVQVLNDKEFEGTVAGTSWALDQGQRTMRTEIDFPNPSGELRPEMYVYASVTAARPKSWAVPSSAILTRDGQNYCFLAVGNRAVRTTVKVGTREGGFSEVLKKQLDSDSGNGLRWGDLAGQEAVIQERLDRLRDGQEIFAEGSP